MDDSHPNATDSKSPSTSDVGSDTPADTMDLDIKEYVKVQAKSGNIGANAKDNDTVSDSNNSSSRDETPMEESKRRMLGNLLSLSSLPIPEKLKPGKQPEEEEEEATNPQSTPHSAPMISDAVASKPSTAPDHPPAELGMKCELKQLYPANNPNHHRNWWTDIKPFKSNNSEPEYAIIVRNGFSDDEGSYRQTSIQSIIIQSPLLRIVLQDLFHGYPNLGLQSSVLVFPAPFKPFVHRWRGLLSACTSENDIETSKHLRILKVALEDELRDSLESFNKFAEHNEITYKHLWTIFEPKEYVYSRDNGRDCAFQLHRTNYVKTQEGNFLLLRCHYVDWNGKKFGNASKLLGIPEYEGSAKLGDLNSFPLKYHPEVERIRGELLDRGRRFCELSGYHYVGYEGIGMKEDGDGKHPQHVTGRIVIDAETFNVFNEDKRIQLSSLKDTDADQVGEAYGSPNCPPPPPPGPQRYPPPQRFPPQVDLDIRAIFALEPTETTSLTDEQLLICSPTVRGFSLQAKEWLEFYIDSIREISWNTSAFSNLVLPEDYKKLLLAFAKSQQQSSTSIPVFDDLIRGKGRGIVILLSGSPGVGKTLTAESVAEEMKVPLYRLTAGDLGVKPLLLEQKLVQVFRLAKSWNAVVLLDEADVFLQKRSFEDLVRNELVSLFLQNLEYFQGTLFLTTNRLETIDAAFESRIHISLTLPELDFFSRRLIWENFLGPSVDEPTSLSTDKNPNSSDHSIHNHSKHDIGYDDMDFLSKQPMNGRQIKNVIKAARLLALDDDSSFSSPFSSSGNNTVTVKPPSCLQMHHISTVLKIMKR